MGFRILGTGSAVPDKILTNDDLSTMVETSDEWITTRVGVKERHVATTETTSSLAAEASRRALADSGVSPADLDLIVCATITADNVSPTAAGEVQQALGASCPAFEPDFYYDSGTKVVDDWDLMDNGVYNENGFRPCNYSAHERMLMGWLMPVELTDSTIITDMPALCDEPIAYLVRNDGSENEYYIIVNLWGRKCSRRPTPPPSWLLPPFYNF